MSAPVVASRDAVDWASVAARLFPQGHDIVRDGDLLQQSQLLEKTK